MRRCIAITVVLWSLFVLGQPASDEVAVRTTLDRFLVAFENLQWDAFRNSFADDATVFYPRAMAQRAEGRGQFEAGFKKVFEQIRGNQTKPPYMRVEPRDLQVKMLGEVAIITFHLDDRPGFLNRRTIVMKKFGNEWKIVHLHASEVKVDASQPTSTRP
jgi:ketosteroid isomerase-like protein